MTAFLTAGDLRHACELKAAHPDATLIAGGTDVMVGLNFGHTAPSKLLDVSRVPELQEWSRDGDTVRLGAGVPYTRIVGELGGPLPGLARAARTIGSAQIRNRATVGGNLGTASPAGDALPPLLAARASIELASPRGVRHVPARDFFLGPGRSVLAEEEIVAAVRVPAATGPEQFAKLGPRNAMVIAVASVALTLDPVRRRVGCAVGSAAPTPVAASAAEEFAAAELDWDGGREPPAPVAARFAALVADATAPIDDVRASAGYRRHAVAVLARRTLAWAWQEYRRS
ncbi:FAD binding domain-containing protein [Nonomuraea sp. NPDC049158]|uniref:FAD binding domain-containing protein n=1 Tax=Nonomuraea sp. NPDC049158 TaxID=3155649 RepID=UPI0033E6D60A